MSVFNVPTQTYPVGATVAPVTPTKPAGATGISVQMAATTDWVTGAAGRTLGVLVERSKDNGVTWTGGSVDSGQLVSPQMGKAGALPTVVTMDVGSDPTNTKYRATVTVGVGSVSTAWTITVA